MADHLARTTLPAPFGSLTLVASGTGLRAVLWPVETPGRVRFDLPLAEDPEHPVLLEAAAQLSAFLTGDLTCFDLPLDPVGTAFQLAAWQALRAIPFGEIRTYGQQAAALGDARKARAVGAANARNPLSIVVPCHRVVGADGTLTGFAGGLEVKAWLLAHEGRA